MTFLLPLGFLAFLAIAGLIIIYIIKPNFQKQHVSSSYVWKLALLRRQRKIPISKLKNLLILICQILILSVFAFIVAAPANVYAREDMSPHLVIMIDAGASMRARQTELVDVTVIVEGVAQTQQRIQTRFCRALTTAKEEASNHLSNGGTVGIIIVDDNPRIVTNHTPNEAVARVMIESLGQVQLNNASDREAYLIEPNFYEALNLARANLSGRPSGDAVIITARDVPGRGNPGTDGYIRLQNVCNSEHNIAITNIVASRDGTNEYSFFVEIASYNMGVSYLDLLVTLNNPNDMSNFTLSATQIDFPDYDPVHGISLFANQRQMFRLPNFYDADARLPIFSFDSVTVSTSTPDSFAYDNSFTLYEGRRDTIFVQHIAPEREIPSGMWGQPSWHSRYVRQVFAEIEMNLSYRWNFHVTETTFNHFNPETSIADIYIFEHQLPERLPTNGIVIAINPSGAGIPDVPMLSAGQLNQIFDSNILFGTNVSFSSPLDNMLSLGTAHTANQNFHFALDTVLLMRYTEILSHSENFTSIVDIYENPGVLVKNVIETSDQGAKTQTRLVVMPFAMQYIDFQHNGNWPAMWHGLIEYFLPQTLQSHVFDIGQEVSLNSRGHTVTINGVGITDPVIITEFPNTFTSNFHGTFTVEQTIYGRPMPAADRFFVRVNPSQSDFTRYELILNRDIFYTQSPLDIRDLIMFFAIAVVALLMLERALHIKDNA